MKTVKEIQEEINRLQMEMKDKDMKPATYNRMKNKVEQLITCQKYIKTHPSQEFVDKEVERLQKRIDLIQKEFDWDKIKNMTKKDAGKVKSAYDKMYDIPKLKQQLSFVKFIQN